MKNPLIIGIAGGSGSGKTLCIQSLKERFEGYSVSILSMDNYYRDLKEQPIDPNGIENFDLPDSINRDRLLQDITALKEGKDITFKEYTFNNLDKEPNLIQVKASQILIIEGIFTFYFEEIRKLLDLKIFIEAPEYLMLSRRIHRDADERGYDVKDVLYRFHHHVMPSIHQFITPFRNSADLIIPNHTNFNKAIEVVSSYIKTHLVE